MGPHGLGDRGAQQVGEDLVLAPLLAGLELDLAAEHLDRAGGVAQMARRLAPSHGFGQQLECADCHVATPDGVSFQPPNMEGDCGMCHSLAFELIDGTVRTLRHGEPQQVVADIRAFYRTGLRPRPAVASPRAAGIIPAVPPRGWRDWGGHRAHPAQCPCGRFRAE